MSLGKSFLLFPIKHHYSSVPDCNHMGIIWNDVFHLNHVVLTKDIVRVLFRSAVSHVLTKVTLSWHSFVNYYLYFRAMCSISTMLCSKAWAMSTIWYTCCVQHWRVASLILHDMVIHTHGKCLKLPPTDIKSTVYTVEKASPDNNIDTWYPDITQREAIILIQTNL